MVCVLSSLVVEERGRRPPQGMMPRRGLDNVGRMRKMKRTRTKMRNSKRSVLTQTRVSSGNDYAADA
jgi:hypothetical protein